jgi:hypothetical protein
VHRPAATIIIAVLLLTLAEPGLASAPPQRTTVVVEVDGGFDWADAGLGAASTLAVLALAYGALLLRRTATHPEPGRRSHD